MKIQKQKTVNYPYIFRFTAFHVFRSYIMLLVPLFFGIKLIIEQEYGFGISLILLCTVFIFSIKDVLLNKPQVKVNHLGIWTTTTNFISWESIEHIEYNDCFVLSNDDEIEKVIIIKVKGAEKKKFIYIYRIKNNHNLLHIISKFTNIKTFETQKEENKNWDKFV